MTGNGPTASIPTATANAAAGLYRALELSPQDPGLRMQAAYQYLVDGRLKEARATLLPIAFDPHGRGGKAFAANVVAMIDAGAAKDAILNATSGRGDAAKADD